MSIPPPIHWKNRARSNPPKRRWVLWISAFAGACVLFSTFVAVFGIGPYDIPSQSRKLEEAIEESVRLGLPMTQAELKPEEPVPDDQNAAIEVVRLAKEVGMHTFDPELAFQPAGSDERAEFEATLAIVSPFLDGIVDELDSKPGWFIEKDYDLGMHVLFPEYADFKAVAKFLSARSSIRAELKDIDGALSDLKASRELRLKLLDDPTVIAQLVAIAIDAIALRAAERIVTEWAGDSVALVKLERTLEETDEKIDPRPAFRGEFYMSLAIIRNLKELGGWQSVVDPSIIEEPYVVSPEKIRRSGLPEGMWARAFMTAFALEWNEVFRSFERTETPPRGWGEGMDERVDSMYDDFKASQILVSILMPVFSQFDDSLSRDDVNQDLHKALVRVMKFRAENGRLPESLEEADAAFPDPFNNDQTIQSIITESEVRIWHFGPNGVDNLGLPRSTNHSERDDMPVFWPATLRDDFKEE